MPVLILAFAIAVWVLVGAPVALYFGFLKVGALMIVAAVLFVGWFVWEATL